MSNEKKLSWASVGLSSKTAVEFPTLERRQGCKDLKGATCLKVTGKHVASVFTSCSNASSGFEGISWYFIQDSKF